VDALALEGEPVVEQLAERPRPSSGLPVVAGLDVVEEPTQGALGLGPGPSHRDRLLAVPTGDRILAKRDAQLVDLAGHLGSDASSHVSSRRFWDRSGTRGTRTSTRWACTPLTWGFAWALQASNLRPPPCKRQTDRLHLTHKTATVVLLGLYDTHSHTRDWCGEEFLGQFLGRPQAVPRGVVGFEVDPRCLLAAVDRGDAISIAGWFVLRHGLRRQVVALA
jgi:hypothetical protein